jgi:hypothetical protein
LGAHNAFSWWRERTEIAYQVGSEGVGGPFSIDNVVVWSDVEAEGLVALQSGMVRESAASRGG